MFDLWRVKRKKRKVERQFRETERKLRKEKKFTQAARAELESEEYFELKIFDAWIDSILSERLTDKAREMDIELPSYSDEVFWGKTEYDERLYLTPHGRAHIRKLIDEEKTRRFEVATRWVKLIGPLLISLLSAAAGVIGAMIGWVAIHKK